jgi:multidrug resistance efflux pump
MGRSSGLQADAIVAGGDEKRATPSASQRRDVPTNPGETSPVALASESALDAVGRLTALREAFERENVPRPESATEPTRAPIAPRLGAWSWSRILKMLLGLALVLAAGWLPVRALLQTTSTEAVINARLITLRAPIEGEIATLPGIPAVGTEMQPGALLLRIGDARADRSRLEELRHLIARLEGERSALLVRRDDLSALHGTLAEQTLLFRDGRARQLEARIAELGSEIAAAEASREEAAHALERSKRLAETGVTTKVAFDKAKRDAAVAAATHSALRYRLAAVDVELSALRRGAFVGDGYNDQPRSAQRADEVAQRLSEVASDIHEREARLASLRADLAAEQERHSKLASADLVVPVRSSVWEIMTAPGETVVRGQDLARLLDCSGLVVTATVGETAYNHLRIGDAARFRFRGERVDYEGRIVGLTGVATAPANLAIQPAALAREPYRVTVALPSMVTSEHCAVGRTGRVTFEQ